MREFKTSEARRASIARALQRRRAFLKESGLCQDCGCADPAPGRTLCTYCLSQRRKSHKLALRLKWQRAAVATPQ
jgi:hypothetical protein